MLIQQGTIYLANLNPIRGHEQGGLRPVLVMQNDILNKHLSTVVIVPLTLNLKLKGKLTTHVISKEVTHSAKDSVALLFQLRTIDKTRLTKKIGMVSHDEFFNIRERLRFIF